MMKANYKKYVLLVLILLVTSFVFPSLANSMSIQKTTEKFGTQEFNTYDLLIITPKEFELSLKRLVDHKEEMGVKTKMANLVEVYDEMFWYGRDQPEKIKYFIKQAYDTWGIKYVLLVGNFRKMPIRYVYNDESWENYTEPCFISDLYYADIYDNSGNFSSWDYNNNGVFGEWKGEVAQDKDIDLRPDVYVGRLACRNTFEVNVMVNKIITYEITTYGSKWFKRIAVVAGDTYPDGSYDFPTPGSEGEENMESVLENMSDFEHIELFTSNDNFTGPMDIIRAFNNGAGFFAFDGHANPMKWSTHKEGQEGWVNGLNLLNILFLRNLGKYPVVVAGACHNNQIDVTPLNLLEDPLLSYYYGTYSLECWGWKLVSKTGGGAISCIANTGLGMTKEDKESGEGAGDYMDLQFFYEYGTNGTEILGECWGKAINRYLDRFPINWETPSSWDYAYDAKTVQQWILLGDPSLKIGGYLQAS